MKNKHKPYQIAFKIALGFLLFVFLGCSWEEDSFIPHIEYFQRFAIAQTSFNLPKYASGGNHSGLPIVWTVINQGITEAFIYDNALIAVVAGEVVIRATVARGANFKDYIEDFTILVVTVIGSHVIIPDGITSIGSGIFGGCYQFTTITIPNSVTSIEGSAFSGCSGLAAITIPDSVTSIGNSAFGGCINLYSITISESVTSVGYLAFYNCKKLSSITILGSISNIYTNSFPENFLNTFKANNMAAGTYIRPNQASTTWTKL